MFLIIVDDFSRNTWLYLMKSKDQSVTVLQQLINHIETQFHGHVKIIRTDNAKEQCEGAMLKLC